MHDDIDSDECNDVSSKEVWVQLDIGKFHVLAASPRIHFFREHGKMILNERIKKFQSQSLVSGERMCLDQDLSNIEANPILEGFPLTTFTIDFQNINRATFVSQFSHDLLY